MNPAKSLYRLLRDNSVNKIELTATPPFIKLIFDRSELEALLRSQSQIADVLSRHFVRQRVFWQDIGKENRDYVLTSLELAETELDRYAEGAGHGNDSAIALGKFARAWAAACATTRKQLKENLDDIDAEKAQILGYDSAGEDRCEALREALVSLRRTVYPLIAALIALLPEDESAKAQAQAKWDEGMDHIQDASIQRSVLPDFDEANGA
jgi:hypothetical protein